MQRAIPAGPTHGCATSAASGKLAISRWNACDRSKRLPRPEQQPYKFVRRTLTTHCLQPRMSEPPDVRKPVPNSLPGSPGWRRSRQTLRVSQYALTASSAGGQSKGPAAACSTLMLLEKELFAPPGPEPVQNAGIGEPLPGSPA